MRRQSLGIVLWTAAVIVLGVGVPANAQEPVRAESRLIPHVAVSGAFDLRNGESHLPGMYLGFGSLEWRAPLPGLGIRLEGLYANRARVNRLYPDCGFSCTPIPENNLIRVYSRKVTAKGALIAATYEIVRRGPFRPFVVGGVGAVETHDESITNTTIRCDGFCIATNEAGALTFTDSRAISGAAHVGGGAVYAWRWISIVAEVRYFAVTNGISRGLNGALPVSLGIRLF